MASALNITCSMTPSGTTMDISIIIVNWNSVAYLRACVASIRRFTEQLTYEIIIVDNASPAGDAQVIEFEFSDIVFIKSDENLGFAGANNLGFRHSKGKYILLLNPDVTLTTPLVNILYHCAQTMPQAGIFGAKLLNRDLTVQTSSIMQFPTIFRELLLWEYLRLRWPKMWGIESLFSQSTKVAAVEAVSGACMLMSRSLYERVGMLSEDYFMYAEDIDLCYKVQRDGYTNYFVNEAEAIHYAGVSSPSKWQIAAKVTSMIRFSEKFYGSSYARSFHALLALNALLRLGIIYCIWLITQRDALQASIIKWSTTLKTLFHTSKHRHMDPVLTMTEPNETSLQ